MRNLPPDESRCAQKRMPIWEINRPMSRGALKSRKPIWEIYHLTNRGALKKKDAHMRNLPPSEPWCAINPIFKPIWEICRPTSPTGFWRSKILFLLIPRGLNRKVPYSIAYLSPDTFHHCQFWCKNILCALFWIFEIFKILALFHYSVRQH